MVELDPDQMAALMSTAVRTLEVCRSGDDAWLYCRVPDELGIPLALGAEPAPPSAAKLGAWICRRLGPWLEAECKKAGASGCWFRTSTGTPVLFYSARAALN